MRGRKKVSFFPLFLWLPDSTNVVGEEEERNGKRIQLWPNDDRAAEKRGGRETLRPPPFLACEVPFDASSKSENDVHF